MRGAKRLWTGCPWCPRGEGGGGGCSRASSSSIFYFYSRRVLGFFPLSDGKENFFWGGGEGKRGSRNGEGVLRGKGEVV